MKRLKAVVLVLALLLAGFLVGFGIHQGELQKIHIKAKRL